MQNRWAPGFTLVEMIIIIIVIAILATITAVGVGKFQYNARSSAAQSDLRAALTAMESEKNHNNEYPSTLPSSFKPSDNAIVTLAESGAHPYYTNLSSVQTGVLFSQLCNSFVAAGKGKGVDQGGVTRDYIQSCGNWNDDGMQVTGWQSKNWSTPISRETFIDYADTFTAGSTWHKAQEAVVKKFYYDMVEGLEQQGGSFPITSFWDSWATPGNGGVQLQPLDPNPQTRQYFCIESAAPNTDIIWHARQDGVIKQGSC